MGKQIDIDYTSSEQTLADDLMRENYEELVIIARARRRRGGLNDTMGTIDLLHEGYLRVGGREKWDSNDHFVNSVALAMRHVIVDHARKKQAQKRGEGAVKISYEDAEGLMPEFHETPEQILEISDLMEKLKQENPRWMRIVDARYFSGLTEHETSQIMGISERSVRRDWKDARDWLSTHIK